MSSRRIAFICLIISSVLWASSGTVAKILFFSIDPIPLAMLRLGVAVCILVPLFLLRKHPPIVRLAKDTLLVGLAACGNFLFFFLGVSRTTANAAAIIYTITPLLTFFLARAAIQEYSDPKKLWGIVLGLIGVFAILLLPVLEHKQSVNGDLIGNLLIVLAMLSWAYYIVGSRKLTTQKHYEPLAITTAAMAYSFVIFAVLTVILPHRPIFPAALAGIHPILILYFGVFITVMTFGLHQWAIKHSSATNAALTNYLQPLFSFAYNAIFIGEKLTPEFAIGSILVLAGTILATQGNAFRIAKSWRRNT